MFQGNRRNIQYKPSNDLMIVHLDIGDILTLEPATFKQPSFVVVLLVWIIG